jgi:flagellar hook-length control protein FliK
MAAPKLALPDPVQTAPSFDTLVGNSLSANQPPPPPEPSPPPASHRAPEPPSSSSPGSAREDASASQSPANATDDSPGNTAPSPDTTADAGPSASDSKAGTPLGDAKGAGSKPAGTKSNDKSATADSPADDQTSTQAGGTPATALIAAGAIIAVAAQPAPVNAATATNSNAPLAIAAAAIAASSSTAAGLSAQLAVTSTQANGQEPTLTATGFATGAAKATVAKAAGEATTETTATEPQLVPTDLAAPANAGLTAAAAATTAKTGTTGFKAAVATVQAKATAGTTTTQGSDADGESATAPTAAAQTPLALQSRVAPTADSPNAPIDLLNSNGGNSPPSAATTRDHVSISPDTQAAKIPTDATAQASAAVQPASPVAPQIVPTGALTATAATGAPVPLGGLAVEIAASAQSGKTRFELRLEPAELGRIDVRIDVDRNGQVTSHLTVEKVETLAILQQDAPQLQQALNDAGLKTGSGGLQFSLRDQSSYGSGQNGNNNSTSGNAQQLVISEDEAMQAALAGQLYGRMSGASAGVDIRV